MHSKTLIQYIPYSYEISIIRPNGELLKYRKTFIGLYNKLYSTLQEKCYSGSHMIFTSNYCILSYEFKYIKKYLSYKFKNEFNPMDESTYKNIIDIQVVDHL